ncbi:MAG: hypothetical protein ACREV3_09410 [Gammaproteobacteria bacterium]
MAGLRVCEKIVASEGEAVFRRSTGPFRRERNGAQAPQGRSQEGDEQPECILKYLRIPSTAGTRDPERRRFFHKL